MKNRLFLSVLLFFFISEISAQFNHPFISDSVSWKVLKYHYPGNSVIQFDIGDTVMRGGKEYYKLNYNTSSHRGIIREDTSFHKVFFYADSKEHVLYDFSVAEKDTFYIKNFGFNVYDSTLVTVTNIDSIMVNTGYRRRIELNPVEPNGIIKYWIDGIGSASGPDGGLIKQVIDLGYTLVCVQKNGRLEYLHPRYNNCDSILASEEELQLQNIDMYPNPVNSLLFIDLGTRFKLVACEIYSLLGELVYAGQHSGQANINCSELESGTYFLMLKDETGNLLRREIIIKE